jgi:hypothetical protein
MKNIFLITILLLLVSFAIAAEAPPKAPIGLWSFQNLYQVTNLRIAEVVPSPGNKPSARVSELRKLGYLCIHKSTTKYLCSKNFKNAKLTPAENDFVLNRFANFKLHFLFTENQPQLTHDGSQQKDYFMSQDVKINGIKYSSYGVTVMQSGEVYFKFIAEEEGSPNLILSYRDLVFSLPVVLQTKPEGQTWGYSLDVMLQPGF